MWQFWLAAAVAGSGLLAKQLFSHGGRKGSLISEEEQEVPVHSANPDGRIGDFKGTQLKNLEIEEEGIFRFSSLGGSDRSGGSKSSLKQKKKKKKKKNKARLEGYGDGGVSDIEQKLGALYLEKMVVKDERKKGRRFCVGLKRRKTGKSALVKCGSSCSSLGLNIVLMYMVSTGKAEINKLSAAVDETTKVINDLRSKLNKRKISCEVSYKSRDNECLKETICKDKQHSVTRLPPLGANKDDSDILGHQSTEEGECASTSSVVTDEPESEMPEMDKLEAELELELQKISCCTSEEPSALKGNKSTLSTLEKYIRDVSSAGGPSDFRDQVGADCKSSLFHGVSPSELDRKLCHLLIEQQENQILELDSRIKLTDAKFHQKEAELEALKDCVRHLKDFSLEIASDEEAEEETTNVEQERNNDFGLLMSTRSLFDDLEKEVHSGQKVVVGMKRTMDCAPYDCK